MLTALTRLSVAFPILAVSFAGLAETTVPDAGRTTQELITPPPVPTESPPLNIAPPSAPRLRTPGGVEVELRAVVFHGNTVFDSDTLAATLGVIAGHRFDQAGLFALADRVEAFYRAHGYAFTKAYIPPQELTNGILRIDLLEGHYGKIQAKGEQALVDGSRPFLRQLQAGELIESTRLERVMMILGDQAGMKALPYVSPGAATGQGDLTVEIERDSRVQGDIGVDNTGNQFTGENRARLDLFANSPFLFGDRISLRSMLTDQHMWLGSLDYELPLGGSGLRGQIGYAYTNYQLGADYAALDASGFAKVSTARLSYPLQRSQASNLTVSTGYQHKSLEDRYGASNTVNDKSSDGWPLGLQFDHRDRFAGGGLTYGNLTWTGGRLHLDDTLAASDATTAQTQGRYRKWNFDIARLQKLPADFLFFSRFSGQWTNQNLDSSERIGIGGVYGVRAYPLGEGMGDRGWVIQSELRHPFGPYVPFLFYDVGHTEENVRPWTASAASSRSLAGVGVGLRAEYRSWSLDSALAWSTRGGKALADNESRSPRLWVSIVYAFGKPAQP